MASLTTMIIMANTLGSSLIDKCNSNIFNCMQYFKQEQLDLKQAEMSWVWIEDSVTCAEGSMSQQRKYVTT